MPHHDWHPLTLKWWESVWEGPLAVEYLEPDVHGLYVLAELVDAYWVRPSVALAAEIRQQRQLYGLTPIDRRRLGWVIGHFHFAAGWASVGANLTDDYGDYPGVGAGEIGYNRPVLSRARAFLGVNAPLAAAGRLSRLRPERDRSE